MIFFIIITALTVTSIVINIINIDIIILLIKNDDIKNKSNDKKIVIVSKTIRITLN